jgi:hypothetical protein
MTKQFGFYSKMAKPEAMADLESLRHTVPQEFEDRILSYLQRGKQIVAVAGLASDVFSGDIIGPPNIFSDGEWTWTSEAIYYVKRYHVRVPDEFIRQMQSNNWEPPQVLDAKAVVTNSWIT